ncbi:hypothetical protein G7075_14175 [Phycicoccus sp. HDW14]|uniref:hypothetical protein n=1 Tax=Phycicoccus sp. HDW14 TaxID=2714941 RepID=UPI00140CC48B|nr:hypothetical protein [Phycicoccus sp. HDW14]QIM22016.1 hypothetical protein G7075_14175 [Phycicoccus sp. HDW14]
MRRFLAILGTAAALGGLAIVGAPNGSATPTAAAPQVELPRIPGIPDCKDAPLPGRPGTGLAGALDPKPDSLPAQADPFVDNPTTSIYDQYGYAGLTWNTYDLGCGGSVRDPSAATDTMIGNVMLSTAVWLTAATNGLHNKVADPASYMGPLDRVVGTVTQRLRDAIWSPWGGVALLGVAAMLLLQALRGHFPGVLSGVVWAVLILGVVAIITQYPSRASGFFDDTITSTIGSLQARTAGVEAPTAPGQGAARGQGALTVDRVLYDAWLRGQLGSSDSAAAKRWGPTLFQASAVSWSEEASATTPEASKQLTEDKAAQWKETADKIAEEDPATYAVLQGKAGGRMGTGAFALLGAVFVDLFRLVADVFLLAGLVMLRLLVMFLPAAAVVGVFAPMSGVVKQMANIGGAAVINVVAFSAGSVIYTAAITAVLSTADDTGMGIMALVLCLVITLAAFVLTAPLLSFTRIFGHAGRRSRGRRLGRQVTRYLVTRQGVNDGTKHAIEETPDTAPEPTIPGDWARPRAGSRPPRSETFGRDRVVWDITSDGGLSRATVVPAQRIGGSPSAAAGQPAPDAPTPFAPRATNLHRVDKARTQPKAPPEARSDVVAGELVTPVATPRLQPVRAASGHDANEHVDSDGVGHFVYDPRTGAMLRHDDASLAEQAEAS